MDRWKPKHFAAMIALGMFGAVTITAGGAPVHAADEPALVVDTSPTDERVDLAGADAAALDWLAEQIQMSIEPTNMAQGIMPDYSCMNSPYDCPANTKCPWLAPGGAICSVTSCGTGSCPICPAIFPAVIVKSWCAYGCMKGKEMVGGAFMIQTRFRWLGPVCIPA